MPSIPWPDPRSGVRYDESVLYSFQGYPGGAFPFAGVIADATGALYGSTTAGGASGYGTVFKLLPR
jgi:uncharacterized repeat protein (TIGR03803 family)